MRLTKIQEYAKWKLLKTQKSVAGSNILENNVDLWKQASLALEECTEIDDLNDCYWFTYFGNFPNLQKLNLRYCNEKLLNLIPSSLTDLSISITYNLNENEKSMLWKLFERLKVIQTLKFNICTNDPKLMYNMLQSVQSVMTIKHLVIRGFISKPCYPLLAKMIKNNPVVSLGIQTNSDIVKFLMLVLKKLTTLRVLNLHFILHSCCSTIVEFIEQNKFISKFTYNRQSVLRQSEYFSLLKAIESNSTLKEVVIPFGLTFNVEAERTLIDSISLRNPLLKIPSKGVVPTNGCQNQMLEDARRMYLTRHHLFMLNSFVSYDILMIMFEYLSITRPSDFLVMVKVLMNRELLGELPKLKQMEFDAHEIVRCCYAFQLLQHST